MLDIVDEDAIIYDDEIEKRFANFILSHSKYLSKEEQRTDAHSSEFPLITLNLDNKSVDDEGEDDAVKLVDEDTTMNIDGNKQGFIEDYNLLSSKKEESLTKTHAFVFTEHSYSLNAFVLTEDTHSLKIITRQAENMKTRVLRSTHSYPTQPTNIASNNKSVDETVCNRRSQRTKRKRNYIALSRGGKLST